MGATNPVDAAPGHDPRRPRARDAGQPRARLGFPDVGGARDRALVLRRRACLTFPITSGATATSGRSLGARVRGGGAARLGRGGDHLGRLGQSRSRRSRVLPESVDGLDVVELGCGTAYVSAWLARRGARPVGVDVTPAQLDDSAAMQARFGLEFPLARGERRGGAAAGRELRPRRLRVRRVHLGRPVRLGPRGRAAAAAPAASSSSSSTGCSPSSPRPMEEQPSGRELLRPSFGMHRARVGRHDLGRVPPRPRGLDPAPARARGSRSSTSSSCRRRRAGPSTATRGCRSAGGRGSGRRRRSGGRASGERSRRSLLLASTSPQRRAILEQLGLPFEVVAPRLRRARRRRADARGARARARARARRARSRTRRGDRPVLGVDTAVVV